MDHRTRSAFILHKFQTYLTQPKALGFYILYLFYLWSLPTVPTFIDTMAICMVRIPPIELSLSQVVTWDMGQHSNTGLPGHHSLSIVNTTCANTCKICFAISCKYFNYTTAVAKGQELQLEKKYNVSSKQRMVSLNVKSIL